jgi:hypothetical protein
VAEEVAGVVVAEEGVVVAGVVVAEEAEAVAEVVGAEEEAVARSMAAGSVP